MKKFIFLILGILLIVSAGCASSKTAETTRDDTAVVSEQTKLETETDTETETETDTDTETETETDTDTETETDTDTETDTETMPDDFSTIITEADTFIGFSGRKPVFLMDKASLKERIESATSPVYMAQAWETIVQHAELENFSWSDDELFLATVNSSGTHITCISLKMHGFENEPAFSGCKTENDFNQPIKVWVNESNFPVLMLDD